MYRCNLCLSFVAPTINKLLSHLGRNHQDDPNFHVLCGISGYAKTYKKLYSYINHLIRKHDVKRGDEDTPERGDDQINEIDCGLYDPDDVADAGQFDIERETEEMRKAGAVCLLKFSLILSK